jgi:hypothetical protein
MAKKNGLETVECLRVEEFEKQYNRVLTNWDSYKHFTFDIQYGCKHSKNDLCRSFWPIQTFSNMQVFVVMLLVPLGKLQNIMFAFNLFITVLS